MNTIKAMSQTLLPGNFLSVDLETTGLDSRNDSIIEIGMVRMQDGEIHDTSGFLINPGFPIPPNITQITGIHDSDLKGQPSLEDIFPDILNAIGDHWIVAHNADFDFDFLNQAGKRLFPHGTELKYHRVIDTLALSRLLLPWLPNHRLGTITEILGVKASPHHRALADAEATALIFQELITRACALRIEQVELIDTLMHGAKDGLRLFFQEVREWIQENGSLNISPVKMPDNILGKVSYSEKSIGKSRIEEAQVAAFFSDKGPLSSCLELYESRTPQVEMAIAVGKALNRKETLMAEAGTGVGKSLAYLAPAVMWSFVNPEERIVLSTHTKTLQDQLFNKELPLLQRIFPDQFSAVLLKGRTNYLCLRRYLNLLTQLLDRISPAQRLKLLPLIVWTDMTLTGDIDENVGFHRDSNNALWAQINCEPGHCTGAHCAFYHDCFLQRIRKVSRAANVVVINHALLFSSLIQSHSILGDFETLIVDEAHQMERIAAQHLGIKLSMGMFWDTVHWLYQSKPDEVGILVVLRHFINAGKHHIADHTEILRQIELLIELVFTVLQEAQHFFKKLDAFVEMRMQQNNTQTRIRLKAASELQQVLGIVLDQVIQAIRILSADLQRLMTLLTPLNLSDESELENLEQELSTVFDRLGELQSALSHFQEADYTEYVVWCEKNIYQDSQPVSLHSVPLDIARILANKLYAGLERCILTSATLTVGGKFDYIKNRLGLPLLDQDRVRTLIFGSPFHYEDQALFLVPTFIPYPKADSYTVRVGRFIENVIRTHPRGALILFTSHKMLREVYALIQPALDAEGIQVLGQGISGSRSALLKTFIEEENSVLLGTASFWEGVDVPGKSLEILVITRIPFDVPSEPLVEARMEEAEKRFGSGFFNYAVPEAVVKFRQGFGRLIRTAHDRGAVLMLDQRAIKSRYGQLFLSSLPVRPVQCATEDEVMDRLEKWFAS